MYLNIFFVHDYFGLLCKVLRIWKRVFALNLISPATHKMSEPYARSLPFKYHMPLQIINVKAILNISPRAWRLNNHSLSHKLNQLLSDGLARSWNIRYMMSGRVSEKSGEPQEYCTWNQRRAMIKEANLFIIHRSGYMWKLSKVRIENTVKVVYIACDYIVVINEISNELKSHKWRGRRGVSFVKVGL